MRSDKKNVTGGARRRVIKLLALSELVNKLVNKITLKTQI